MRSINEKGLALIVESEGLYLKPYLCPAGVPTIGIGTIKYKDGKSVTLKDRPITKDEAYDLLRFELVEKSEAIDRWATENGLVFNDNQFSALCSLAYNCGTGIITDNERSMSIALLSQEPDQIRRAFLLYCKATVRVFGIKTKKVLPGLLNRRKKEVELYFS